MQGGILFSGSNSENLTSPDPALPFNSIAKVSNDGGASPSGSAVHIRGKYLLTADHVANRSHVTFDDITYWARDTNFTPIKIGTADLKLIKLLEDPGLAEITLADSGTTDTGGIFGLEATLVCYGRGISTSEDGADNTWTWGSNATIAKRWGTNDIESAATIDTGGNTYTALVTRLDSNAGDDEMGLATFDSGSALFVFDDEIWQLAGIATLVTTNGSSTFGGLSADENYFVRIQSVRADIEAAIPDTTTLSGWLTDSGLYGSDASSDADPDLDGITNLAEFAMGTDPTTPDNTLLPSSSATASTSILDYQKKADATGITVTPEWSEDIVGDVWSSTGIIDTLVQTIDGIEYRQATYSGALDTRFMRLNVTEL